MEIWQGLVLYALWIAFCTQSACVIAALLRRR
jgi:hypothetical protein